MQQLDGNHDKLALVEAIIQPAKVLNIEIAAQGVEHMSQAKLLGQKQCQKLQGYAITRPIDGEEFPVWHKHYTGSQQPLALH